MATRALQQVLCYTAWNTSTNAYVTGDVANHTTSWSKDGTRSATTNTAAEVDATNLPGLYKVTMTATETDCIEGILGGKSSTANVVLIPTMVAFDYLNTSAPAAAGILDVNVKNFNNVTAVSLPANFASLSITAGGLVAVTSNIKKNTALAAFPFEMLDATTNAPKTGLTVTATRRIDAGAFAACANAVTELANGWYTIDFASSDLNGNTIAVRMTATGAADNDFTIITQP